MVKKRSLLRMFEPVWSENDAFRATGREAVGLRSRHDMLTGEYWAGVRRAMRD